MNGQTLNRHWLCLALFTSILSAIAMIMPPQAIGQEQQALDVKRLMANPDNLVFAEDFSDVASVDRFRFSSRQHWKRVRVGDRYALEHVDAGSAYQPPHRSPHNIALINSRLLGSFVVEYEAQQIGREYGHRDACVFFNFVDPAHYYYAHISTNSDDHAHQIFTVDDAPRTKITQHGTDGFDWQKPDTWHRVRLVRDLTTGKIVLFVNDMQQPIMEANDTTHKWGRIGFGSFDDTGRVTNIRVYAEKSRPADIPAMIGD